MTLPSPGTRYAVVATGGIGGALLRAGVSELVPYDPGHFPTALLLTQAIGCGLAGLLTPWLLRRGPLWSLAFLTGALASFTTYGLFTGEILALAPEHLGTAVVYLVAATVVGVAAATGGLTLAMGGTPALERLTQAARRGGGEERHTGERGRPTSHPIRGQEPQRPSPVQHRRRWRR